MACLFSMTLAVIWDDEPWPSTLIRMALDDDTYTHWNTQCWYWGHALCWDFPCVFYGKRLEQLWRYVYNKSDPSQTTPIVPYSCFLRKPTQECSTCMIGFLPPELCTKLWSPSQTYSALHMPFDFCPLNCMPNSGELLVFYHWEVTLRGSLHHAETDGI